MNQSFVLHVEVTAEDIAEGLAGYTRHCPLALAVKRAIGERFPARLKRGDVIAVEHSTVFTGGLVARLPVEVLVALREYDRGEVMQPFEVDLEFI